MRPAASKMADQFIGLQMLVTLRSPPARLKGTVSAVDAGAGLTLSNVWMLDTNHWEPRITIASDNIAGLAEIPASNVPPKNSPAAAPKAPVVAAPGAPPVAVAATTTTTTTTIAATATATTVPVHPSAPEPALQPLRQPTAPRAAVPTAVSAPADPAILMMGKRPGSLPKLEVKSVPNVVEKRGAQSAVLPVSRNATPTVLSESMRSLQIESRQVAVDVAESPDDDDDVVVPAAAPAVTFQGLPEDGPDAQQAEQRKKRRSRARHGNGSGKSGAQDDGGASPQPAARSRQQAGQGKGWRQTPMLQAASFQPFNSLKRNGGKIANDNGWASEDVTDVQEMGDFDFEGELAKFDKHNLFEQMRKDDMIDEADRLVSHNRQPRPKPGTAGGKNLHYTENVLDLPPSMARPGKEKSTNDFWNSEADDGVVHSGERSSGRDLGSRQGSHRSENKASSSSARRSQSRKASAAATGQGPNRVNSGVSSHPNLAGRAVSRPSSRLSGKTVDRKRQHPASAPAAQGLYVLPSNRRLEPVSPLQMLNLENIAHNEIGLTEDMMTENAGRGVAEVALTALADPAIRVRHAGTADPSSGVIPPPTVVVLAGNNKSGMRAIAAARHLRNKGVNALVCVVGLERGERELLEDVRQQIRIYKNLGGRVFSKTDLFEHIRKLSIPTMTIDTPRTSLTSLTNPAPVTLIIDALLGLAVSFEDLRTGDQATTYELIEWANRNEAFVLAVDVPTGIDPSSGKVSVVDGTRLYVKPRFVVAIGCPKRGLLEVIAAAANDDDHGTAALGGGGGGGIGAGGGIGGGDGVGVTPLSSGEGVLPDDAALEWKLFIVDMGLGASVWKKAGTKIRRGIDFDDKWVLEMRYQGTAAGDGDEDDD